MADADLAGHVRLGVPDDYADRFLPEILARFSRSNPRAEVSVLCEPSLALKDRILAGNLDLAIVTHYQDLFSDAQIIRQEQLYWVTSQRSAVHEETPLPLAMAGVSCAWRKAAEERLKDLFEVSALSEITKIAAMKMIDELLQTSAPGNGGGNGSASRHQH